MESAIVIRVKKIVFFSALLFSSLVSAHPLEKIFYSTPDASGSAFSDAQLQSIRTHAKSIDIIAPQVLVLSDSGAISGSVDPRLIAVTQEKNIKLMPLLVNQDFRKRRFHILLYDPAAEERAIASMLAICEKDHLYGLQFDFEHVASSDKNALTHFVELAAAQLHQHHFVISVAVVPPILGLYDAYDHWAYENWAGAYDFEALGKSVNFLTVMCYDLSTSLTTPGPIAPLDWAEKVIETVLKVVPANKISLGVADYSGHWVTGRLGPDTIPAEYTFRSKERAIAYPEVVRLLKKFNQTLVWQNQWKSSYVMFDNHYRTEFLFVQNAKSFNASCLLAKKLHLRGISVWQLGLEDPGIWNVSEAHPTGWANRH